MFELTTQPIITKLPEFHPNAGGIVTFEGRVRETNDGKTVKSLEYEAYPALVLNEGEKILQQAQIKFKLYSCHAIHRHGHLQIGDIAVWIYAASMHRKEAFAATEFIIHEIKHRLPIWKKEHYTNGNAEWVRCNHTEQA